MELFTLIGDSDENFYQLGLRDRQTAKEVHRDVRLMLNGPWKPLNKIIEEASKLVIKNSLLKNSDYYSHLKSYSEGLEIPIEEAAYTMLVPELVSCVSKWAPGLIRGNLGCSSFFMRNHLGEVVHGRILDFPLQGSFDVHERAILYDLSGMPKTLGFGATGIPYPSITLMTEDGMTLALHQKFTNVFNKDGMSIFEYIFDLVKNARDKKSVIEYLQTHQSITTWCLYISFKNGDVLGADLMGKELSLSEYSIPDKGVLYFCNHLENKTINQELYLPTGFHQYNLMREEVAAKKIHHFLLKKEQSDLELIKMMATPYDQKIKHPGHYEHYKMDPLTPSSIQVMTMNPSSAQCYYVDDLAPKIYRDNLIHLTQCFSNPTQKALKPPKKTKGASPDYYRGMQSLMSAQKGFDLFNPQEIYHHLQFSIDHLEGHLEKGVGEFYFLIAQYLYETHPKVLMNLLHSFKKMEDHLPQNLNDHCLLFIGRLERILGISHTLEEDKILHPKLRAIYQLELKIPKAIFHLTTKKMMMPRIDLMDVIYIYTP
ncbi:MAG: hypothetical protein KBD76_00905 [Bacteriovorax sp.]|nr:hypothetical protein [Bacteriovorax sp.]